MTASAFVSAWFDHPGAALALADFWDERGDPRGRLLRARYWRFRREGEVGRTRHFGDAVGYVPTFVAVPDFLDYVLRLHATPPGGKLVRKSVTQHGYYPTYD